MDKKAIELKLSDAYQTIDNIKRKLKKHSAVKNLIKIANINMTDIKKSLTFSKGVDELNCSICMDYVINCRTAVCGHSFCEICISESLIHRKECPNCRKDIRKWVL